MDIRCRYVSLDDITANFRGMARAKAVGHAEPVAHCRNITDIVRFHLKPILAKMIDPGATTTASGTFEDLHTWSALSVRQTKCHTYAGENRPIFLVHGSLVLSDLQDARGAAKVEHSPFERHNFPAT